MTLMDRTEAVHTIADDLLDLSHALRATSLERDQPTRLTQLCMIEQHLETTRQNLDSLLRDAEFRLFNRRE